MSIFPEKVVRTRGTSDGGFFSEIYSLDSWVNLGLLGFCIALLFFIVGAPIISSVLVLLFCVDIDQYEKPHSLNIVGILLSVYLLIDIYKGWVMSFLFSFIFDSQDIEKIIYINCASIFTNLFVLIFADTIFNLSGKSNFISFIYISAILFISYQISSSIF